MWNDEVQKSLSRKRLAKKMWDCKKDEESIKKNIRHKTMTVASKAEWEWVYYELYNRLNIKEGFVLTGDAASWRWRG